MREYELKLTAYERDNLLDLLIRLWGVDPERHPPTMTGPFNGGDWVGQIPFKLGFAGARTNYGNPNPVT